MIAVGAFSALAVACGSESGSSEDGTFVEPATPADDTVENEAPKNDVPGSTKPEATTTLGACATSVVAAAKEPTNVLFVIDRSGSMHEQTNSTGYNSSGGKNPSKTMPGSVEKWAAMKEAFMGFIGGLPEDTRASAMMFPQGDASMAPTCCKLEPNQNYTTCGGPASCKPGPEKRCDAGTYKLGVPFAPLGADQRTMIESYIAKSDKEFYWGTPLAAALSGAVTRAQADTQDGVTSIVLFTDGTPTSCQPNNGATDPAGANDQQRVVDAAKAGFETTDKKSIRTFVIGALTNPDADGSSADPAQLEAVAKAGGTDKHFVVNGPTFAADLTKALDSIRSQTVACTFAVPTPKEGTVDTSLVNLEVTSAEGRRVMGRDTSHANGWDFLSGEKQIQVYGEECTKLQGDATVQVNVVAGCTTVVK